MTQLFGFPGQIRKCDICQSAIEMPPNQIVPEKQEVICHLCFQKGVIWAAKRAKEEEDATKQKECEIIPQVPLCEST